MMITTKVNYRLPLRKLLSCLICALLIFSGVTMTIASVPDSVREGDSREVSMPDKLPFAANERLIYSAEFSRLLLRGIDIAEVRFAAHTPEALPVARDEQSTREVSPSPVENEHNDDARTKPEKSDAAFHFTCEVSSRSWFQRLFNLTFRLSMKSLVDAKAFAVSRTLKLEEQGKRHRESDAVFDRAENIVTWTERNPVEPHNPPRVVRTPLQGATQDLVSVFYYLRTQPLKPDTRTEITLSDSGQIYRIPLTIGNRSKLKTVIGEIPVIEVKADMFGEGRPLRGKGSMTLWFSDDARHVPVRARITSEEGTLDIKLKQMTGNDIKGKAVTRPA
ncbi:MAG: DUF3108 domain-containing protein [Pyrinomonadaceae bacterium MAG19_C2-C3]|nr:DUF3108 domain-containing protein [Pyrinomonadaceae bacterium MAG19_C2-C3]